MYWIYIIIDLFLTFLYLSVVLIWSILGAILNPTAYLCYASASASFILFVNFKYTTFMTIFIIGSRISKNAM